MNVPHRLLTVALVVLSLSACGDRSEAPSKAGAPAAVATGAAPVAPGALNRAMRISVNMALVAKDVDASAEQVRTAVNEAGGYVSQSQLAGDQDSRSATLQAKVPADQLVAFRQSLRGFGTVAQESEKAEDVTEQQADIKARVRNAKAQEKRLLELLSDRTGSLADVLTAEKSLAEIRETIERLEAQETTLDKQIAFATLDIRISSDRNELALSPGERISSAFGKGFTVAGELLVVLGVILVGAAPSLVMLGALAYASYRLIRLFRGRKAAPVRG